MTTAVDDVFAFLESEGLAGGSTEWNLLVRRVMDAPAANQCVIVAEDGGDLPELEADAGIGDSAVRNIGVLVTVRAEPWDSDAGFAKAYAIWSALHSLRDVVLGGSGATVYLRVRALTPEPIFAGYDDQGRPLHTVALRLLRLAAQ
jgi:Bacteriophage minor capsid protein